VVVAQSLEYALDMGRKASAEAGVEEVMVIGGEQIYRMTLPAADRLYLTQVDADVEGDAFFPEIDAAQWHQVNEQLPMLTDTHPYRFLTLDRI
jgi:dihydrofolate reductase